MSALVKSIQLLTPPLFQKVAKSILRPKDRSFEKELKRLSQLPRYQPTTSSLLGAEIELVDACTFLAGYSEIFEQRIYNFQASTETPLIIDCGANIGLSVTFFKQLYPHSRIVAFEPDPQIFSVLEKNVKSLGFSDVDLHQKAIWIDESFMEFSIEGGYSGRIPKPGDRANLVKVKTARLRDFLDRKVDFLKLDIEGAEAEVIRDCQDKLANVEHFFIEYHSHNEEKQSLHEILAIAHEAGFRYHVLEAFTSRHPFIHRELMLGMDLQLNIFCYRV